MHTQTGLITIHCAAKLSAQCNEHQQEVIFCHKQFEMGNAVLFHRLQLFTCSQKTLNEVQFLSKANAKFHPRPEIHDSNRHA